MPVLPVVREAIEAYITSPLPAGSGRSLFRGARGGPRRKGDPASDAETARALGFAIQRHHMRCVIASQRICWPAAAICDRYRNC